MRTRSLLSALLALLLAVPAAAATITIVNLDGAGEGFNDPTPAAPVGGNAGTTIGQQRLNVFQRAADLWGALLPGGVTIAVDARFDPLTCSTATAVLGQAGPKNIQANFAGAEYTNMWYHQALANKLAGVDLTPGSSEIQASFNSTIGDASCLGGTPWYYGYDHNEGSSLDLLAVVLHELAHGLGFSTTTGTNGAYMSGMPGLWDRFLYDRTTGLHWTQMNSTQRTASAINTGNLVWDGRAVTYMVPQTLGYNPELLVTSPQAIARSYAVGTAQFGAPLTTDGIGGLVAQANDGSGLSASDGCEALINASIVNGRIAMVDRGNCTFVQKVRNAQNAGAIAVIVADNGSGMSGMSGVDPSITIPSVLISQTDGNTIRAQLANGVNATLRLNPALRAGASAENMARLYAPNPVQSGSSVSHFDMVAAPNLLMEPAINSDLTDNVDLTRYLFEDIGWLARTTGVPAPSGTGMLSLRGAPNPFRQATTLRVDLAVAGMVDLTVFDLAGRPVRHLVSSWMPAGSHSVAWDGSDGAGRPVAPGVYLTRLKANGTSVARPIVRIQ